MEVLPFSQMNIRTPQTNNAYIPQEGYSIPLSSHLDKLEADLPNGDDRLCFTAGPS